MSRLLIALVLSLAACGADGPPERPGTGATVSGQVETGVTGG
jgi:predicted small lipoprotein YifL